MTLKINDNKLFGQNCILGNHIYITKIRITRVFLMRKDPDLVFSWIRIRVTQKDRIRIRKTAEKSLFREREENRQQVDRSQRKSRGRAILSKRSVCDLESNMEETTPYRPRTDSTTTMRDGVGFINIPIGMGPAAMYRSLV